MINTLQTICKKINYDHKTYQIEYNPREDFILSAHCCSYIIKWNPHNQEILKEYYPNQLSSFTAFKFVKHRKLILVIVPNKLILLDYNLKETNNYSLENNQIRFQNNFRISNTRLYIQVGNQIYILSLNNLRLLKIHDIFQTEIETDNLSQSNNDNYRQYFQYDQNNHDKILFDIYGDTLVTYNGKSFNILPDQICQENEHYEAEIERIIRNINNNKVLHKEIFSFYFFSQSCLLIISTPVKTFFINLNDYSFFYIKTGNCMKVTKNQQKNIFYWTSQSNDHFVTFLDFKVTQLFNQPQIRIFNTSFVIDYNQKLSYLMNNESLKQLKCIQFNNYLQPYNVFTNPNYYIIHDRLWLIKTCFQKQLISECQFTQLYEANFLTADHFLFYLTLVQQQQSLEVANLI